MALENVCPTKAAERFKARKDAAHTRATITENTIVRGNILA